MRKWLAIVLAFALVLTQVGAISFADVGPTGDSGYGEVQQPPGDVTPPSPQDKIENLPEVPTPWYSNQTLQDGQFEYGNLIYPYDLTAETEKSNFTFYYFPHEERYFLYKGKPVTLNGSEVLGDDGQVVANLKSVKITSDLMITPDSKDEPRKLVVNIKLKGFGDATETLYYGQPSIPMMIDTDIQFDVSYSKNRNGDKYEAAIQGGVAEWSFDLTKATIFTNEKIIRPIDITTVTFYSVNDDHFRLPPIRFHIGDKSAGVAFGKHRKYRFKAYRNSNFEVDLSGIFEYPGKYFDNTKDSVGSVASFAYTVVQQHKDQRTTYKFEPITGSKFSQKLNELGFFEFHFIGLNPQGELVHLPIDSLQYDINVLSHARPKLKAGVPSSKTIQLEVGATEVVRFKDFFEISPESGNITYEIRKAGARVQPTNDEEYHIVGESGEVHYRFFAHTEQDGDVYFDIIVQGKAKAESSTPDTGNNVNNSSNAGPSSSVVTAAPIGTVEFDQKTVESAVEEAKKNGSDYVRINIESNSDKVEARLTPQSLQVLEDKGLIFANKLAQVVFPPSAMKFVSEEEALRISVEKKDPKKPVDNVDMRTAVSVVEVKVNSGDKPVTEFGGESISIQLPANDTYKLGSAYRVIVVSEDGTVEEVIGMCKLENGVKVVSVPIKHLSTFILTSERKASFQDVAEDAWYAEGAKFTNERGILVGGDKFEPYTTLTRIEIVNALHRLAGQPMTEAKATYTDVQEGRWYNAALNWATEKGIVAGKDDGSFGVYDPVTREQLLVMLQRYADKMEIVLPQTGDIKVYEDSALISDYAKDAIQWAGAAGLAGGAYGKIMPQKEIQKSEIATVLMKFVKAYEQSAEAEASDK